MKYLFLPLILLAFGLNANGETIEPLSKKPSVEKSKVEESKRKELNKDTKKQVLKVLKANEGLHAAFFKYDSDKVSKKAAEVKTAIDGIKDETISKKLKLSKSRLSEISKESTRQANNQRYDFVSKALIHIIDTYNLEDYNGYSCPMVKKVWVQNSKINDGVMNPYAPEMPACGSKDTKY